LKTVYADADSRTVIPVSSAISVASDTLDHDVLIDVQFGVCGVIPADVPVL